ncbi:MAG: paired small multidrug resistance pump [Candidatus Azotimanducaceae bacterium]|jgi:paired small multidrug resistance pump
MEYEWHDLAGNVGVFCVLVTYALLQFERLSARGVIYSALNALGAGLIALSLIVDFNLSAFVLEVAWLALSLIGLLRVMQKRVQA